MEAGRQHYGGDLKGKWILTAGLGGMGGAQPLAAVMAGACCLAVECDETRGDFRIRTALLRTRRPTASTRRWPRSSSGTKAGEAKSIALIGNCRRCVPRTRTPHEGGWSASRHGDRTRPRRTTPCMATCRRAGALRNGVRSRRAIRRPSKTAAARQHEGSCRRDGRFSGTPACRTLDYGNNIRQVAKEEGLENAFAFPGLRAGLYRPLFCRGIGPFRWCALSGDTEDIYKTEPG